MITGAEGFSKTAKMLLDADKRILMGRNAAELVRENEDVADRHLRAIIDVLRSEGKV